MSPGLNRNDLRQKMMQRKNLSELLGNQAVLSVPTRGKEAPKTKPGGSAQHYMKALDPALQQASPQNNRDRRYSPNNTGQTDYLQENRLLNNLPPISEDTNS